MKTKEKFGKTHTVLRLLLLFVFALHPDHKFEYMVPRQTTPHLQKYINITIGILHVIFYVLCHKYSNTYIHKICSMVKFGYSEKNTKFEKNLPLKFDTTE